MIKRELGIFLLVGSLTVLVDFLTYRGLLWLAITDIDIAKAIGFITGTIFAYFANRFWTFNHKPHAPGSAWRFALLYLVTLGANVFVNEVTLDALGLIEKRVLLAFCVATGVSATLNFLGMKYVVFHSK